MSLAFMRLIATHRRLFESLMEEITIVSTQEMERMTYNQLLRVQRITEPLQMRTQTLMEGFESMNMTNGEEFRTLHSTSQDLHMVMVYSERCLNSMRVPVEAMNFEAMAFEDSITFNRPERRFSLDNESEEIEEDPSSSDDNESVKSFVSNLYDDPI